MIGDLFSLAYFSRNLIAGTPAEAEFEIARILEVAREKNRRAGISGALLFSGGCFAQVLEGPRDAVEEIFETIQCDPRHSDVTILHLHPIEARSFPEWSMAYAGQAEALRDQAVAAAALASPDKIVAAASGQSFLEVLRDYVQRDEQAALGGG
jgi:Sensors of blue-light using FAD